MMITCKKISSQVRLNGSIQKICVHAQKFHYKFYYNGQYYDIFMMNHLRKMN